MIIEEYPNRTHRVNEGKFGDFIQKAVTNYNYYTGKRDKKFDPMDKFNFAETAPNEVLKGTDFKDYINDGTEYKAKMDRDNLVVQIVIDATEVGKKLAPLLNPKSEDKKLLKYMKGYDKNSKTITLVMPVTNETVAKRLKDEEDIEDEEETEDGEETSSK